MAEALLHSDKLTDSIEHLTLNSRLEADNSLMFNSKWYPKDSNSAKAITFYNMSVAHAIRGEIDMAYRNFNISVNLFDKQPAYTYFMKLYLDLLDGYRQSIQVVLKENFGHVTSSHSLHKSTTTLNNNQKQTSSAISSAQLQQLQQQHLQQQLHMQQQQQQHLQQLQFQSTQSQVPTTAQQHLLSQQSLQLQQLQLQQLLQQQQLQQQPTVPPTHLLQSQGLNQYGNLNGALLAAAAAANVSQQQQHPSFLTQNSLPGRIS